MSEAGRRRFWQRPWVRGALLTLATLAVGGALVAVSGVMPVKASSGHWPITEWLLHFAMRRSTVFHSLAIETPPLDDPALVLAGAGHYENGCRPCHGSPVAERPRVVLEMTPQPPIIPLRLDTWRDRELFTIVRHGIKFTAMPAWPSARRDDEVWSMVAFLRRLPELDESGYRLLTGLDAAAELSTFEMAPGLDGTVAAPREVLELCARCHGASGQGRPGSAFPRLAGQHAAALEAALEAYADGRRHSGIMEPLAAALPAGTRRALARHYAALPGLDRSLAAIEPRSSPGGELALAGDPGRRIPACVSCHAEGGRESDPHIPRLRGQNPLFLEAQLELLREGRRGGSDWARLMEPFAHRISAQEAGALAAWFGARQVEDGYRDD